MSIGLSFYADCLIFFAKIQFFFRTYGGELNNPGLGERLGGIVFGVIWSKKWSKMRILQAFMDPINITYIKRMLNLQTKKNSTKLKFCTI